MYYLSLPEIMLLSVLQCCSVTASPAYTFKRAGLIAHCNPYPLCTHPGNWNFGLTVTSLFKHIVYKPHNCQPSPESRMAFGACGRMSLKDFPVTGLGRDGRKIQVQQANPYGIQPRQIVFGKALSSLPASHARSYMANRKEERNRKETR